MIDGVAWDSKGEYRRWKVLYERFTAGRIKQLRRQVNIPLTVANRQTGERVRVRFYRADFTYWEDGVYVIEDHKGHKTEIYLLKKAWVKAEYGIEIKET